MQISWKFRACIFRYHCHAQLIKMHPFLFLNFTVNLNIFIYLYWARVVCVRACIRWLRFSYASQLVLLLWLQFIFSLHVCCPFWQVIQTFEKCLFARQKIKIKRILANDLQQRKFKPTLSMQKYFRMLFRFQGKRSVSYNDNGTQMVTVTMTMTMMWNKNASETFLMAVFQNVQAMVFGSPFPFR